VLLKASRDLPRVLKTKRAIVGVRIPDDPFALHLVERFGGCLMVSTVPKGPQGEPFTMGYEVHEAHGHALDYVVDLGEPLPGTESTVLDLTEGECEVVRLGAGDPSLY
jgi:tRNA A37 threonylcarbamoyladenosine synthetase subunit TsaC/SUA5/YrdC